MSTAETNEYGAPVIATSDAPAVGMTPAELKLVFSRLTNNLNELAEVDWAGMVAYDASPADTGERLLTLNTLAGMLQSISLACSQAVSDLLTAMTTAMLQDAPADGQ